MPHTPTQPQGLRTHAGGIRILVTSAETDGAMPTFAWLQTDSDPPSDDGTNARAEAKLRASLPVAYGDLA